LIRDFRDSKKVVLNLEHKLMQQVAPNNLYDSLPSIHKLEVFEYALANTSGEDLAKILWLKSETSDAWLHRRANYTRSMAVMSMVGYVLGLGDRHPSNLMLDRKTGKVLHIDFGDCFEVAMKRDKFPERVPFRLTRMLVKGMEISGIEGSYRLTCEEVMSVLRTNKDSLLATLEAFVHDPLVSWRLLYAGKGKKQKADAVPSATAAPPVTTSAANQGPTSVTPPPPPPPPNPPSPSNSSFSSGTPPVTPPPPVPVEGRDDGAGAPSTEGASSSSSSSASSAHPSTISTSPPVSSSIHLAAPTYYFGGAANIRARSNSHTHSLTLNPSIHAHIAQTAAIPHLNLVAPPRKSLPSVGGNLEPVKETETSTQSPLQGQQQEHKGASSFENLHLELSELANSVVSRSPSRSMSHSLSHRSLHALSAAQMHSAEGTTGKSATIRCAIPFFICNSLLDFPKDDQYS
jgi:hypothetical protein